MNKVSSTNSLSSLNLKIKRPLIATDDDRNNYRPMSLSESYVSHIDSRDKEILSYYPPKEILSYYQPNDLLSINSISNSTSNIDLNNLSNLTNENYTESLIQLPPQSPPLEITANESPSTQFRIVYHHEDKIEMVINKVMLFFLHLFLISLFELIFFFGFVTKFENKAIVQLIGEITNTAINSCKSLNTSDKQIIDYLLNSIVNSQQLLTNSNNDMVERNLYNNTLLIIGIAYFLVLLCLNIFIFSINKCYFKRNINYKNICLDNCIMIILLGLYEYMFFSYIVFQYQTSSTNELIYDVYNQVNDTC
jgi:hypothetical protein